MSLTTVTINEDILKTFEKRFFAGHYAYRDFKSATTSATPTAYVFGDEARTHAVYGNVRNWPRSGDTRNSNEMAALTTYARSVMVQCTEDAYIILVCINPRWTRLYTKYLLEKLTSAQAISRLSDEDISLYITEVPQFIPANALITFNPTMAYAIYYYYSASSGTIRIWAEGNTEGME